MILGRVRCKDRCKNLSYFIRKSLGYLNPSHLSHNGDSRTVRDVAIKNSTAIKCVNPELIPQRSSPNNPVTQRCSGNADPPAVRTDLTSLRSAGPVPTSEVERRTPSLRLRFQTSVKISYQTERRYLCNSYNQQWTVKEELLFQESSEKNSRWKMEVA